MAYQRQFEKMQADIEQQQQRLTELKLKEKSLAANEPRAVAEFLHEKECHWNHTDGCAWFYETWDGATGAGNSTRMEWLRKAEHLIKYAIEQDIPVNVALELRTMG